VPLRVSAISFLNPAPLLYNFEHEPTASALRAHYDIHYTTPAHCALELHAGAADLGLIPIAELTPALAVVPGCTIASLHEVRSILLLVRNPHNLSESEALRRVVTLSADTASRSSIAYARLLLKRFYDTDPILFPHSPDPLSMLADADAALLIGDPALLAREHRAQIDATVQKSQNTSLLWIDLAALWREHTGLPWVAAVWAVRPEAIALAGLTPQQLIADLNASRDHGLAHIEDLVREWTPRISVPPATIRTYLTRNIHYTLSPDCLQTIELFRSLSTQLGTLPPLPQLTFLT
jgi:chorismate dehydratase